VTYVFALFIASAYAVRTWTWTLCMDCIAGLYYGLEWILLIV